MRVCTLLSIVMLLSQNVFAVKNRNHDTFMNSVSTDTYASKAIQELQQTRLGKLFFEFAELSMMTTGAIESLLEGIRAFGRQIEDRLDSENEIFDALAGEHNSKVLALQSLVNQAELDINREKKRLNQELVPRSAELDEILLNLKDKKELNRQDLETAVATRESQHEAFVEATNSLTEAIRGIDETLELIEEMAESGEVRAAFIEVSNEQKKKVSKVLKQVKSNTEKFGHQFSSFIQALTQMSESQNFKDREVFKDMKDLLNSLRGNLQENMQKAYSDEDSQSLVHEQRVAQLADEEEVFGQQYAQAYQEREEKGVRISDTQAFIDTRSEDLASYEDRLRIENNSFASNQKIHDDLVGEINEELSVLEKVLDTIQTPPFQDFLAGKMTN